MKPPAFQFYAADYLADEMVQLMTLEEEGVYIRLLAYCWREGSIPSDPVLAGRLCKGAGPDVVGPVLQRFAPGELGRLVHPRLEQERQKNEDFRAKMAKAGKRGNAKRWGENRLPDVEAIAKRRSSSSSSSTSTPKTLNLTPPPEPGGGDASGPKSGGDGRVRVTPVQMVVLGFKHRMGIPEDDKAWDRVYFARFCSPAKGLLTLFGNDPGKCLDCIDAVVDAHERKRLSWTPETILKHAGEWRAHGRVFE